MSSNDKVMKVLGQKYSTDILLALDEPTHVQKIANEVGVPVATCYRRIEALQEVGLIEQCGTDLTDDRKRVKTYKRSIDVINILFENGMGIETEEKENKAMNELDEVWRELSG